MNILFKLLCYIVWSCTAGVVLYGMFTRPEIVSFLTAISLILGGISLYLYAIHENRKGLSRQLTLVPVFIGICLLFDL